MASTHEKWVGVF